MSKVDTMCFEIKTRNGNYAPQSKNAVSKYKA